MIREYSCELIPLSEPKEYFYVGTAHTLTDGKRIVKIGTTKQPKERRYQHRAHKYSPAEYSLKDFEYVSMIQLSKANTIRLETCVRNQLQIMTEQGDVKFLANDRFVILHDDAIRISVKVHTKVYEFFIP